MPGLNNRYRTLGELMTELRARLGFVAQGAASKNNDIVIKSFLQESHEYVFGELKPPAMRKQTVITLQAGSHLYDWNDDQADQYITPGNVMSLWIKSGEGVAHELTQGIRVGDRSQALYRAQPEKFDTINGQLEVWPTPDQEYPLTVEYTQDKARFEQASDRPSVPDRLVFLYALAISKAHYRHPDSQASATTFQNMLNKEKFNQKENRRYFVGQSGGREAQVVRTGAGYSLGR